MSKFTQSLFVIFILIVSRFVYEYTIELDKIVYQGKYSPDRVVRDSFPMTKLRAFVVGGTGEVGKAVIKELAQNEAFENVTLIGRREIPLPKEDASYSKFNQKIVDFDKLSTDHANDFHGYDVGFCALGTTRGKAGVEGFIRVDHDYVVDTAKLAKEGGCKHFNLVSSGGSNKDSYFLYPKIKGQVEHELSDMGFERLSIWKPAVLLCDREEKRTGEALLRFVLKPLDRMRYCSIEVPVLARVMVNNCLKTPTSPIELIGNRAAYALDGELTAQNK